MTWQTDLLDFAFVLAAHRVLVRGLLAFLLSGLWLVGCGRTSLKLYEDGGPLSDSGRVDGGVDGSVDGGVDAGRDGAVDAGPDAQVDSGLDGGRDSGVDGGVDSGVDGGVCALTCNDGVSCTQDTCDPATGECVFMPDSSRCDPGQICTARRGCVVVACNANEICSDRFFCNGAERCENGICVSGRPIECADSRCQVNHCDERTRNCVGTLRDDDNDGFAPIDCMGGDCDDNDARVFPGATEQCTDGRDNNCDGRIDCDDARCAPRDVCNPPPPRESNCNNGLDDNFNGLIDCEDPDCFSRPVCQMRVEICGNGIDDDMNGRIDCEDPACGMQPECQMRFEICDDRLDNDGDNAIDCDDSDCVGALNCMTPICPNQDLGTRVGRVASGTTRGAGNDSTPPCVPQSHSAPDITFSWRAPRAGSWTIDTIGSAYDTALYVRNGGCNGALLACNDDSVGLSSRVSVMLTAGQAIVIVVDGFASGVGNYVLNISSDMLPSEAGQCADGRDNDNDGFVDCDDSDCFGDQSCVVVPRCPDGELGSQVGAPVIADSTSGQRNDFTPSCLQGASNAPDVAYSWRAPQAGRWVFDTMGSTYDTALSVLRGSCTGPTLACNDDSGGGLSSSVTVTLARGDEVVIVVDGYGGNSGNYVLNIGRIVTDERGQCADFIDNDGDGAVDCMDGDCVTDPVCRIVCQPTESGLAACTDGIDNDCDMLPDCADPDCLSLTGNECCNGIDDDGDRLVDLLACGCDRSDACDDIAAPIGNVAQVCWPRLGACGPDCSSFGPGLGDTVCRFLNPTWRCQRSTGQCVVAPQP